MTGKKLIKKIKPFNKNFIPHFLGKLRDEPKKGGGQCYNYNKKYN